MLLIKKTSNTPPNNEIWYTSLDGNIIDITATSTNNTLLSNNYEDKGVLVFENAITNINNLFNKTQLKEVWLPNYNILRTLNTFMYCSNLRQVNNSKQLKEIEEDTFYKCTNLLRIEIDSSWIGDYAFAYCASLNYVKISKRLGSIYEMAFRNCTSLESIDYEGTIDEWNNIYISDDWRDGSAITTIHCSDGDIQL